MRSRLPKPWGRNIHRSGSDIVVQWPEALLQNAESGWIDVLDARPPLGQVTHQHDGCRI